MASKPSIKLGKIIDMFNLEVLYGPEGYREKTITIADVNRPGLQLTGFFDYFDQTRLQVTGLVEDSYLKPLSSEERRHRFEMLFEYDIPALILARGLEPFPECVAMAKQYERVLLRTNMNTAETISNLVAHLRMAPHAAAADTCWCRDRYRHGM